MNDHDWTHGERIANNLRFHYVEAGDPDGPLVLLLHGFPEFWYAWRNQIPALADAGYHVVAPDLRGYNDTEKPPGVASYSLSKLVKDVLALIEAFSTNGTDAGEATCPLLVGHDWGGVIAWEVAIRHPERLERLAVLNAPHPERFQRALGTLEQLRRSWYAFFFQLPWVPERAIAAGDYAVLDRLLREDSVNPAAFDEGSIDRYKKALAKPGARTASINYYRALGRDNGLETIRRAVSGGPEDPPDHRVVRVPTLLLWGDRDTALTTALTEGLDRWVPNLEVERLPNASHWVQADAPEAVNKGLLGFLTD